MQFTKSHMVTILVGIVLGIPMTFFGETLRSAGLAFIRYNDFVIVGVLLLTVVAVLVYAAFSDR